MMGCMDLVEEFSVPEASDVSAVGGFFWSPIDPSGRFDPVTDVAVGAVPAVDGDWVAAVVEHCAQGMALLESIDPTGFDRDTTAAWAKGVEQLRRQAAAAAVAVADHLDGARPFKDLGFFTAKQWMTHHLQLSGPEAFGRVQEARLCGSRCRCGTTRWPAARSASPRPG